MTVSSTEEIDWTKYARQYDLMCSHNDAYEANVSELLAFVRAANLPNDCSILDIGAGTGNFAAALSKELPYSNITHLDSNREMNSIALQKYSEMNVANVQMVEDYVQRVDFPEGRFDLAICVNALYAMQPQELILSKIHSWLSSSGYFYVVDLGRKMDSWDWGRYFFRRAIQEKRLLNYVVDALTRGQEVLKQNNVTTIAQESGRYWTHNTSEFGEILEAAGFKILRLETCYRGYADLAICKPI